MSNSQKRKSPRNATPIFETIKRTPISQLNPKNQIHKKISPRQDRLRTIEKEAIADYKETIDRFLTLTSLGWKYT